MRRTAKSKGDAVTLFFMVGGGEKGRQMLITFCERAFPTIMAGINKEACVKLTLVVCAMQGDL